MDSTHKKPESNNRLYRVMIVSIVCVSIACWITVVLGIYYPDLSSMSELFEKLTYFPLIADILHFITVIVQYVIFFSPLIGSLLYMLKFALFIIFGFLIARKQAYKRSRNILRLYSLSFVLAFICYTYGLLLRIPTLEFLQIDSIFTGLYLTSIALIIITTIFICLFRYAAKAKIIGSILSILAVIKFLSINLALPLGWLYTAIVEGSIAALQLVLFAMISSGKVLKDSSTQSLSPSKL